MLRKLTVLVCLVSLCPAAAGAQDLALLANSQPALERPAEQAQLSELKLMPSVDRNATIVVAANDVQSNPITEAERPRKTHDGLSFREFVDVHFGGYRWIWWAGAAVALVAIHAN